MRVLLQQEKIKSFYPKLSEWVKLISITGSAQLLVQLTGFVSGILIIRLLPTQEYALYTLANTMLGTMTMLADSGIANGVMAEGGKVWQDKERLGTVIVTGLELRKKFGIVSLIVTLPVLAYLLVNHGASWLTTALIVVTIIPAFFAALSDSLLEIVPRLHQDIKPLQKNGAEVSIGRLILSALFLFIFPFTFIALIANGLPRIYGNYRLKKISSRFASHDELADPLVQKEIIKGVKRTLPIVVYYCISGQISIWLISFFGSTTSISQLGALGRLAMVFNLFTVLFSTLIVPRFSRMKPLRAILFNSFLFIQLATVLIAAILLFATWLFSSQILWLFGKSYLGLDEELMLTAIANGLGLMVGVCSQLILSRGWFLSPFILIGFNLGTTIISLTFLKLSSLKDVLYYNIIITSISFIIMFIYGIIKINSSNKGTTIQ